MLVSGYEPDLNRRVLLVLLAACVMIFFTSFELLDPIVSLGLFSMTTSELAAAVFLASVAYWAAANRESFFSPRFLDVAVTLFVASNLLSVAAAEDRLGALKFSLRMAFAALIYLGVSRLPSKAKSHIVLAAAATFTLLFVTLVGLAETFVPGRWTEVLAPLHGGLRTFGSSWMRTSSTLPVPNILALYLELTFPWALAFALVRLSRVHHRTESAAPVSPNLAAGPRRGPMLISAAIIVGTAAVMVVLIYTFTRTALAAMPVSLLSGALLAWFFGYWRRTLFFFALAAVMLLTALVLLAAATNEVASRLELAEPVQRNSATYEFVETPSLFTPGEEDRMLVRVTNTSNVTWKKQGPTAVIISSFWQTYPGNDFVDLAFITNELPEDVTPGQDAVAEVRFNNPREEGLYVLVMELAQLGGGRFSDEGVAPMFVAVEFGAGGGQPFSLTGTEAISINRPPIEKFPSRRQLWSAAIKLWKESPVVGIGADQFRSRYAEHVEGADTRKPLLTHNIFLEALVNTGVIGLLALLLLLGSAAWAQLRLISDRAAPDSMRLVALGLAVALMSYTLHGLLDTFLSQSGIAFVLFAQFGTASWLYRQRREEAAQDDAR